MTTLITDGFDEPLEIDANYEPHNIVYGALGWTDDVDDATITVLVRIGAIRLVRAHAGLGWETRIYVSVEGDGPSEAR